ncbi:mitochondrial 3-hydroxyisobutyryl-CoA hydrolase [Geopyxis carbonaria]|nr:mitochondrial 3-hydroxyisobutyryl-CoA hydrolase [Geopyxis carbonaria]
MLDAVQATSNTGISIMKENSNDDPNDVRFNSVFGIRTIELNRPEKLNSLNASMVKKIVPRLQEWEKSGLANIIVIKGAGEKAFCAGGDVAALAQGNKSGSEGIRESTKFFGHEYQLNHLIATYSKPYVAFIDGITMGGGVGLSVHAPFRIATERTLFAMPETLIGFFPDVGGSFFLSRLDGELGTYLALTGESLKGVNTFYAGIATHYIHSSSLPDLEERLAELSFPDNMPEKERNNIVNSTIEEFVTGLPGGNFTLSGDIRQAIDRCFRFDTINKILEALRSESTEWAEKTIATLLERSPTSLRVALKQMRLGKEWTISETFQREFRLAARFMKHPDFVEGVDARLIRKTRETPEWSPPSLEVEDEAITEEMFTIKEGEDERLPLLKSGIDYMQYPHELIGLPSELHIENSLRKFRMNPKDLIQYYDDLYDGKRGVKPKVHDVISRMTTIDENGFVKWRTE